MINIFVSLGSLAMLSWLEGFVDSAHERVLQPLVNRWFTANALAQADFHDAELPIFRSFLRDLPNASGESLRLVADSLSGFLRCCPEFRGPPFTEDIVLLRLHSMAKLEIEIENKDWPTIAALVRCIRLLIERRIELLENADIMGSSLYAIMLEAVRRRDGGTIGQ
ncbi:uncharacterized protein PHACADRAFT_178747 [Phanerochaete carnosa HHB-10118-sp]|uniref:Uncharacterized protein n=1 Tax=Phanerochaete carnosa (strain HHB-10118-sp) TaxID=650164 RepID=K5VG10_PHACS|nr:uncharacterized protein PHACADRAFT_178747 [Phanerochaete carnosa HHB-10118-sp]EKM50123.1 hypothetical protein PHACADRAFT_178747 [Phanerochaete carnosa HHB-10118-sp]